MKVKVAFVCTGNSCRSQMAEGWARRLGNDTFEVYSAGTQPTDEVNVSAIRVMKEAGVDISDHQPKLLTDIPDEVDILIKMGCGVDCPYLPHTYEEDWGLADPVGKPIDEFRRIRDEVKQKVERLIERVKQNND